MHKPQDYAGTGPKFDLYDYFAGKTYAWGQFQDRSGKVLKQFKVDIQGDLNTAADGQKTLVLDERFLYRDGARETRIWTIRETQRQSSEIHYIGTADDVVGKAKGVAVGNTLNWQYVLDMPYKNGTIHLNFNDWMFLQGNGILLNRADVTKWGFKVGEVTIVFSKTPPAGENWMQQNES